MPNTPYETNILQQPDALRRVADQPLPDLSSVDLSRYDRIILTGMGASDFAAIPTERALAAAGLPVVRIDTGQLLDRPQRVTPRSLLWATSQSGRSGELVALLESLEAKRPAVLMATTDDTESPLAAAADILLPLESGPEATVSTKSYLNTLAVHARALAGIGVASDPGSAVEDLNATADVLAVVLDEWALPLDFAARARAADDARFAYIGIGDDAATALTGALITKEASKVPVEGFIGGAFRHGPLELAGPGLTAVLFGPGRAEDPALPALARDLQASGSAVLTVGPHAYGGSEHAPTSDASSLARLMLGSVHAQLLTLALSAAVGEDAGSFAYGRKVTATL